MGDDQPADRRKHSRTRSPWRLKSSARRIRYLFKKVTTRIQTTRAMGRPAGQLAARGCLCPGVLASDSVTPSLVSTGVKPVPRRRFQKGSLIVRGKTPMHYGIYREDVLQSDVTFKRAQRWVALGFVSEISVRVAWKMFQPYLNRVNEAS